MKTLAGNPRVAIVYHYWASYREPIVRELCQQTCPEPEYDLISGTKVENDRVSKIKTIEPQKSNATVMEGGLRWQLVNNLWLGRIFLWQSGLLRLAFSKKYDVIIYLGSMYFVSTWFSAILARLCGKKVLMWGHGYLREENNLQGFVRKLFYRISHGMLLYGNRARQIMIRKGFKADSLYVIYNSLDYDKQCIVRNFVSKDTISDIRRQLFKFPEHPVLFFIGRLTSHKRLGMLIDAAKQLHLADKPVNLLFIGGGSLDKELHSRVSKNNLDDYAYFHGSCYEENELGPLIMSSDVCVSPGEVGLTAIHAMVYGKPVITHNNFSKQMPEFESIIQGRTGSFYEYGNFSSLVSTISYWIDGHRYIKAFTDCISIVDKLYNPHTQVELINAAVKDVFAKVKVVSLNQDVIHNERTNKKNTVVVVSNGITPYGTHFLRRVANELQEYQLRTIFSYEYSMGHWAIELPESINAKILGKGEESLNQKKLGSLCKNYRRGRDLIKEIKTIELSAVMILGYGTFSHFLLIEWCKRVGIPCLMFGDSNIRSDNNTGFKAFIKKIIVSRAVSRCAALLPCGSLGSQYFQKYGASADQIFFVPYEPDYSLIENVSQTFIKEISTEFDLKSNRHRLIFSGRLTKVKRIDLLIDVFVQFAALRDDWDLLVIGGGPLERELKVRVPDNLRNRIIWTGFINSSEKMAAFYKCCDVLVLPSDYEPWALVINEAACAGLAIVCSDIVGAAAELLCDGENGRLFLASDRTSLLTALLDVTDDINLCRYKTNSTKILNNWRKIADPVEGFRNALEYCLVNPAKPI